MKFFNTDGIRGKANEIISSKICYEILKTISFHSKKILIGYDTRESSETILNYLKHIFINSGCDVDILLFSASPLISFVLKKYNNYDYGFMITASHNPYFDNGIKIFNKNGDKLSSQEINDIYNEINAKIEHKISLILGKEKKVNYFKIYLDEILKEINFENNFKIVVDLANGAFYFLKEYLNKMNIDCINYSPNGRNINEQCGALYPEILQKYLINNNYDYGFCFDGDGDRLIMVDKNHIYSGDQELINLIDDEVVITIITNMAFKDYFKNHGINYKISQIGDSNVLKTMKNSNISIGGELSGHILYLNHPYSDSLYSLFKLIKVINEKEIKYINEYDSYKINIFKSNKNYKKINEIIKFLNQYKTNEDELVIRESGTEDCIRISFQSRNKNRVEEIKKYFLLEDF